MSSYPESLCGEPRRGCAVPQPSAAQFAEHWVSRGEVWSRHVGHSRCVASGTPAWAPGPGVWLRRRGTSFSAPRKPPEAQLSPFCRCVSARPLSGPRLPRLRSGVAGAGRWVQPQGPLALSGADGAGRGAAALARPVPAGPRLPAPRPAAAALLAAALPTAAGIPLPAAAGGPGPGAAEERPAGGELGWGHGRRRAVGAVETLLGARSH